MHIRQDILNALETGDFTGIPPQGYSRNMVKSYSRLLGLDAKKMTEMFLDSEYSYQIGQKRKTVQKITRENKKRVPETNLNERPANITPRQQLEYDRQNRLSRPDQTSPQNTGKISGLKPNRTLHTYDNKYHNTPRSRGSFDSDITTSGVSRSYRQTAKINKDFYEEPSARSARERLEARKRHDNTRQMPSSNPFDRAGRTNALKNRHSINRENSYRLTDEENPNSIHNGKPYNSGVNFMNIKNSPAVAGQSKLAIPVIAGIVVVLLILLICVFFFLNKQHENDKTDVSKLNVVGISDVENPDSDNNKDNKNENKPQLEEPKEVEFKYAVKQGQTAYIEIYEGSNKRATIAREVKSGETNSFKVTDKLLFKTTKPTNIDIFVNGETVAPQDANGKGVYVYTVDFNEYLKQWKAKHPNGR